jgi:alpha-1,3-rhamnosyl/mannosyltransferase
VLFPGTLEPRKNLDVLLDAYERLIVADPSPVRPTIGQTALVSTGPGVPPLVLAGRATPEAAALVDRARRPPLAGHVEITGYIDADRRRELYERALVFVLPSHTEGFGMPVLEAMTVGVPVVAANRGALPEVAGRAGRLVDPHDAEALSAVLREILGDADLRQGMRDAGWTQARQYSWSDTARRVREAWTMALLRHRERRG